MENRYEQDEAEIDLKQLLIELLSHFRWILLCALLFAALLGGYKSFRSLSILRDQTAVENATQKYEKSMGFYEQQLASYDERIAQAQKALVQNLEYREKSILLNLDAHSYFDARADYYVTTNYKVNPQSSIQDTDKTYAVLKTYEGLLNENSFYGYVQRRLTDYIEIRYLQELISVSIDREAGNLRIVVVADTYQRTSEIMEAVKEYIASRKQEITELISEHEISLIAPSESMVASKSKSETTADQGLSSVSQAIDVQARQDSNIEKTNSLQTKIKTLQDERDALEKPEKNLASKRVLAKDILKLSAIGFFLGGVLSCAYIFVRFLMRDRVLDEAELSRRFAVPVLASVRRFSEKGGWNRMLYRMAGDGDRAASEEAALRLAAANARLLLQAEGIEELLLSGLSLGDASLVSSVFAEELPGIGIMTAGNLLTDRDAVLSLEKSGTVLLVERRQELSNRMLSAELTRLRELKKAVLGVVLL